MAAPKKIKTVLEDLETTETANESVELTENFLSHSAIVVKHGVIEFTDGKAVVSSELAALLRLQGFIK